MSDGVEPVKVHHGYSPSNGRTDHDVQRGSGPAHYHPEGNVGGLGRHLDLSLPPCDDGEATDRLVVHGACGGDCKADEGVACGRIGKACAS